MSLSLADVDLTQKLSKAASEECLAALQRHLLHLRLVCAGLIGDGMLGPPVLVLFEGWDASGKGGAIRRLVAHIDPRHVSVTGFGTPSTRESRHHFLWRFFPHLPGLGGMSVFDRTWYGRVLVERVENLAAPAAWQRAYDQINDIERALGEEGMIIIKLFLHISDDEQLRRFEERRTDPLTSWKLTEEDWRNRSKRSDYETAIDEMLARTSPPSAPWSVIAGNSKHFARVSVLEHVIARIEHGMRMAGIEPPASQGLEFEP